MQRSRAQVALLSVLLGCASPTLASAQDMYPGQDVTVNPGGAGSGMLLYPGGKYGRVVGPLLQPGDPYPGMPEKPIHLHMPYRHVAKHVTRKPSVAVASANTTPAAPPPAQAAAPQPPPDELAPPDTAANLAEEAAPVAAPAAPPAPRPQPAPAKHVVAASKPKPKPPFATASAAPPPAPASAQSSGGIPLSLGEEPVQPSPPPAPSAHPTRIAKAEPPPAQTAPPPARTVDEGAGAGLTKQSQIIFASGVADPAPSSIDAIKGLSTPLNSALAAGATRVQVVAYGGARGDKSSDARRLSLKRALIIRQLLIDGGVPSDRIDVRAMGGANDSEPSDRVDIFTKA